MTFSPDAILNTVLDRTLKAGADAADARIRESAGLSVEVRNGELETVERDEARGLALRVFVGKRQAHVSASDLSSVSLDALCDRVVQMAKLAPEDPYCGLPPKSELAKTIRNLGLQCNDTATAKDLEDRARQAEAAALKVRGVKQVTHAGAGWSSGTSWLAATNGFRAVRTSGATSISVVALAERKGAMERDYESHTSRLIEKLRDPTRIGRVAGKRAASRLGAQKVDSQTAPVIFENRVAGQILGAFIGAISGPAVARGVSFLKDRMGEQVWSDQIQIVDNPLVKGGMGSRAFDGEGRRVKKTTLVDQGRLTQWLLNGPSARQLGLKPNGFASTAFGDPPGVSTSNLTIAKGRQNLADLMQSVGTGLLVTDMFGPSLNPNNGDYSVGVSGFWFENGKKAYPVSEVTVAGDLPSMFLRAVPATDLEIRGASNSPSLLFDAMSLAGR